MPIARIDVKKRWPAEQQCLLIDALHAAMMEALRIPERDRNIRYIEHQPEHFATPPDVSENYVLIELSMFPGRSLEAKRLLYQGIVKRFGAIGIQPKDIFIVIHEVPMDNWGIRGGIPASEVQLGFKIDV
jgi:phenylpyruvate tautomerase PptA (4-oxalocrotonate tautomerase family)